MYQNLAVATAEICQGRMAPGEGEQLDTCVLPDPQRLPFSLFLLFFYFWLELNQLLHAILFLILVAGRKCHCLILKSKD